MFNCPNCGAGKTGPKCSYCGTILEEPSVSETTTIYADNEALRTTITVERHYADAISAMRKYMEMHDPRRLVGMKGVF